MKRIAGLRLCVMSMGLVLGSLARAEATVGRTEGDAGVTVTGAARYTIPLALPPGTNGLVPSLAITYDSRGGNGLLGVGFRLSGLSAIHRCGSTLAQDGKLAAVALDWADRFCLDGQRLRLATGSYGTSGSRYQTEVESFTRVTALGAAGAGPASFRAERRDGLIYEYGTTADSRVESVGSSTPREWAVSRIRDRYGNYVDVVYAEDLVSGAHRPLRIDYTGNLLTGAAPYYSVRFAYESRPANDQPSGYVASGIVSEPRRLDRLDVVHVATGRVVRSFDLVYAAPGATGRSVLASLQECAGESCLPPTQFSWTAVSAGWSVTMPVTMAAESLSASIPGDIDGDGFDDLAYRDPASHQWAILRGGPYGFQYPAVNTGLGTDSDPTQAISTDVDGDGNREILVPGGGNYWYRLRWTSSGTYVYSSTGVINPAPAGGLIAADVDGDGRDDLVYVKSAGSALYWRRNQTVTSSSYAAEAVLWTVPTGTRLPAAPFVQTAQRFRSIVRSGEFNGDGRDDLLVLTQQSACSPNIPCTTWVNRWTVLVSTGSALVPQYTFDGNSESLLADFNADGLTDIGYWAPGGPWRLLLGSGSRGTGLAGFAGPFASGAGAPPVGARAMIIDWDADGRADVLQPTASGDLQYCRSTGASLEPCQAAGITPGTVPSSPTTLDINGDGYVDLVYSAAGVRLHLHHQVPPDTLLSATDGLGARSEFEYAILASPGVHKAGTGSVFPVRDVARLGHVVSRMTRAGESGSQQEAYFYEGAKDHAQGRGFLGFARRTTTPVNNRPVRVEEYLQDPVAIATLGAPARVTLQQSSGVVIARTSFVWGRHAYGSGYETRGFAYPSRVTTERYELDGVPVSSTVATSVVDAFGTTLQREVRTTELGKGLNPGAVHVATTTLAGVVNDTTNWCLGRPASTQVSRWHTLRGGAAVTRTFAHGWDYARCRAIQQVVEPSSTDLRVTTDLAHDAYGNPTTVSVTPAGQPVRTTTHEWMENGRFLRTRTNPEGHVETLTWDIALARLASYADPNGLLSRMEYDDLGRPTRQVRPDGTSTALARTACGTGCAWPGASYVVSAAERGVGDVHMAMVETGFDRYEREVYRWQEQPGGSQSFQARRYDSRGFIAQESLPAPCCAMPLRWVSHAYDTLGRRTSSERPTSQAIATPVVTRWRHDGLAVTETDALGRSRMHRLDALGRVLQVVDTASAETDYEYDAFGNLVTVRDAAGAETVIAYDVRGFRRSITDPNAGRWIYDYLPLGELRTQTNARGQTTAFTYDRLSRPLTRVEPEGTTTWIWGNSTSGREVGSLASVYSPEFRESYQYDALGRPATVTTRVAGATMVTRQSYDPVNGRPGTLTYPSSTGTTPLRIRSHYDRGRLVRLSNADTGATYWQLNAVDSLGKVVDETLGNGVRIASTYDAVTGLLAARTAGPGGGSAHQNLAYAWDELGNLALREERNRGTREQFFYDDRDRLDYVSRDDSVVFDLDYDDVGNLVFKSDVGPYRYDTNRRHAVIAAGHNTYAYDANGAVVNASGATIDWLSFDLPRRITHPDGNYSAFYYGPDRARYRQVARSGSAVTETLYAAGGLYERVTAGGATSHRHYLVADGRRVAVHTRSASAPQTVYLLEDHQGSVDGFTAESGALLTRNSYQPYGARRSGDWLGGSPSVTEWQQIQVTTRRGYTDHEHLDNLGIIHMNGRVYDPVLGRFLSPDPMVQAPYDSQSLNRYSYVRNNPLRFSDPSGLCFNRGPAADSGRDQCLETIVITANRWLEYDFMRELVAQFGGLRDEMFNRWGEGGGRGGPGRADNGPDTTPTGAPEEIVVSAQRSHQMPVMPADFALLATYNLAQSWLMAELLKISTAYGEDAVNYYVGRESETGNALYRIPGMFAALWTPGTARITGLVLGLGTGLGAWSGRPFWKYTNAGSRNLTGPWLARGLWWSPPYGTGFQQAQRALQIPQVPTGVVRVHVSPFEFVSGPRPAVMHPEWGTGGGFEYFRGWGFPE